MDNKILVAEDEEKIRRLVSSYLVREGFKVVEAADGSRRSKNLRTTRTSYW